MMTREKLFIKEQINALGLEITDEQVEQFYLFYQLLIDKNKVMNLTAITEFEEVVMKHFVDSISLIKAIDLNGEFRILDLGTGAGFPGIPLKIMFPNLKLTLLDSLNKRIIFLNEVIELLKLHDIEAIHGRAEDLASPKILREKFDLCVSRAVANLSVLSEYCIPFVKIGGKFISYKSEKIVEELEESKRAVFLLGGKFNKQIDFYLPDTDIYRNFIIIDKVSKTAKQYPRKAGTASKNPL
ncbi:MAG: 16S rRNA (guanine(527)-N(7))-methyltransferase RsmG [Lachnospiraceae bacterium]